MKRGTRVALTTVAAVLMTFAVCAAATGEWDVFTWDLIVGLPLTITLFESK